MVKIAGQSNSLEWFVNVFIDETNNWSSSFEKKAV